MADLNALIAQGVQFKQPESPLNMMAQLQQLQSSQNQNALAQYQLGAAQRADVSKTALNQAYAKAIDPVTGKIDYTKLTSALATGGGGAEIPTLLKQQREGQEAEAKASKAQVELVDSKLKQSRSLLDTVNTPDAYLAWHEANHADPVLGPVLAARGITADTARAQITAALQQPGGFEQLLNQSKLGSEKFMEINKAQLTSQDIGGTGRIISTPGLGGASTVVPGSTYTKTATPSDLLTASTAAAGQQVTKRGQDITAATAAKRLAFEQTKFNWEKANPGFDLIQDAEGAYLAVNKKNKNDITPLMMAAPAAAGAAPAAPTVPGARGAINVTDGGRPAMVPVTGKAAALNESQGAATAFGMRMKAANDILEDLSKEGTVKGAVIERTPFIGGVLGQALPSFAGGTSETQQQFNQAKSNFITAILRKESGAAIGQDEFEREDQKYFPQINDGPKVIKQKSDARKLAIKAMAIQAGPGAKNIGTSTESKSGNVVTDPRFPGFSIGKP